MIAKVERFNQISVEMCDPDCDMDALMAEMGRLQDEIDAADGWDCLLYTSCVSYDADGLPLEFVRSVSVGESASYLVCK